MTQSVHFFDQIVFSPREELRLGYERTLSDGLDSVGSLKGRAICLIRVVTHAAGIVVKPVYCLIAALVTKISFYLACNYPQWCGRAYMPLQPVLPPEDEEMQELNFLFTRRHAQEMYEQIQSKYTWLVLGAFVAPISQGAQAFKAALGVLYPGFYFKTDELLPCFRELAATARQVGCSPALIDCLDRGVEIVRDAIARFPNPGYYSPMITNDIRRICEAFRDPAFPASRKLALLTLLNPQPRGSGIEACPGGLGRTLQQIRSNLHIPEDPNQVIPWLAGQLKGELLIQMVMSAEEEATYEDNEDYQAWQRVIVERTAHDAAHRGNALILAIGEQIGLPAEMIERVRHDPTLINIPQLAAERGQLLRDAFAQFYTAKVLEDALMAKINTQPDGSPGLKTFRKHVINELIRGITEAQLQAAAMDDPTKYVFERYVLHQGRGSASDPQFDDLNALGIRAFAMTLGAANPFQAFP